MFASAPHGHKGEVMPVHVVVYHEAAAQFSSLGKGVAFLPDVGPRALTVSRETRASIFRLVPGTIFGLATKEEIESLSDCRVVIVVTSGKKRYQGPRGLRRRTRPHAPERIVHVRSAGLAPSAIRILTV